MSRNRHDVLGPAESNVSAPVAGIVFALLGAAILLTRGPTMSGWIWLAGVAGLLSGGFLIGMWVADRDLFTEPQPLSPADRLERLRQETSDQ